jgi:hypothetical protein
MRDSRFVRLALTLLASASLAGVPDAQALDLDWSGQFRAEAHWIKNYQLDSSGGNLTPDSARDGMGGYYIPGGGSKDAQFQTLFLRLRPKLIVNDNVYIKSEWWVGDPIYGAFGDAAPYGQDQKYWYSNQSRGSLITAQRFWGEFVTDIGTVVVGRAPLNYGLGVVWNGGDGLWDRYQSTGDQIRLVAKFGAFTLSPAAIKYSAGNSWAGACNFTGPGACAPLLFGGGVSDYSLLFKYENPDEEFEGGLNFIKRIIGSSQDPTSGYTTFNGQKGVVTSNINTWDIYAKKTLGKFSIAGEVPIVSGELSGAKYNATAVALEAGFRPSDAWDFNLRAGRAPGQPNSATTTPDKFEAFYFNPAYKPALILFNYQLANFVGPHTLNDPTATRADLRSPYDNPITNAQYLSLSGGYKLDRWRFGAKYTFANAMEACAEGSNCFNTWSRSFVNSKQSQEKSLGWEMDYGASLQWDENFLFGVDVGWWFPGAFYKYSNVAGVENATDSVFATVFRVGVTF